MDKDKVFIEKTTSYYTSLQRGKQNPTKRVVKVTFVTTPTQRVARLYNKRKHNDNKKQYKKRKNTTPTTTTPTTQQ